MHTILRAVLAALLLTVAGRADAQFLNDTFTESTPAVLLSDHTPETGGTWTKHGSYADNINIYDTDDFVYGAGGGDVGLYYNTASPASADYSVSADIFVVNNANASYGGVAGRVVIGANTMYRAYYRQELTAWRLEKMVAGTPTTLGSDYTQSLTNSQTYTVKLEMIGTSIKLYVDGVERISATDSDIAGAGKAAVMSYTSGGQQPTSITATDIGGGGGGGGGTGHLSLLGMGK